MVVVKGFSGGLQPFTVHPPPRSSRRHHYQGDWGYLEDEIVSNSRLKILVVLCSLAWMTRVWLHFLTDQGDHAAQSGFAWYFSPLPFTRGEMFRWWGELMRILRGFQRLILARNTRLEFKFVCSPFLFTFRYN